MLAFHSNQKLKEKYVKRVQKHYDLDEIIQGIYWENGKGGAVGCTVEVSNYYKYETELGIPVQIAILEDAIFEELKNSKAKEFPLRFIKAVTVGSDLSQVIPKLVIWQFEDKKYGLKHLKEVKDDKEVLQICQYVTDAYRSKLNGDKVTEEEWEVLYQRADKIYKARAGAMFMAGAWAWAWAKARRLGTWPEVRVSRLGAKYEKAYEEYVNALADKFISLIEESK